jgi:hypothetical protein
MMYNSSVVTIRDVARLADPPMVVMSCMINQDNPVSQQVIECNPQTPTPTIHRFIPLLNGEPAEQVSLLCTHTILRRSCGCSDEPAMLQAGGETRK